MEVEGMFASVVHRRAALVRHDWWTGWYGSRLVQGREHVPRAPFDLHPWQCSEVGAMSGERLCKQGPLLLSHRHWFPRFPSHPDILHVESMPCESGL